MSKKLLFLIFLLFSISGFSQSNLIGQKAPLIEIEKWIYPKIKVADWHVQNVPDNLSGKVIVLDFWFTQCAPCVASIPKLNDLAKQFPEILFLSISFEKEKPLNNFLEKMVMYYPVGLDPTETIIKQFGVFAYPETFLIDKNGIIQWKGSPFELSEKLLNKVLGQEGNLKSIYVQDSELPFKNSAYEFTLQKHELGMNESSYFHYKPYDINVFNKDLPDILSVFYGYSKSRILCKDTSLLSDTYDITLKADKKITTEANCIEMFKYLLPNHLEFDISTVERDTCVNMLKVYNDTLLRNHLSEFDFLGSSKDQVKWSLTGATLFNLKSFLENEYNILLEIEQQSDKKIDFVLPPDDYEATVEKLEKAYGIEVKPMKLKTQLVEIKRKKNK